MPVVEGITRAELNRSLMLPTGRLFPPAHHEPGIEPLGFLPNHLDRLPDQALRRHGRLLLGDYPPDYFLPRASSPIAASRWWSETDRPDYT